MQKQNSLKALKLFNEKAEKLKKCSFTKMIFGNRSGVTLSAKVGEPIKIERQGPNEEAIDAFVLTFRFFIQDNEKSSFRNIAKIYEGLPVSQQKKDLFKYARNKLNEFLDSHSMLKINDQNLTNRQILDIFIYGGLSHANEKKKVIFDRWMANPILSQFMINEFVFILGNVMNFIMYIQNLNNEVIRELEGEM